MPMSTPLPSGYRPEAGPRNATRRPFLRRWLVGGALVLAFLLGGAMLAFAVGASVEAQFAPWAVLMAVLPLAVVVPAFLWLDRLEAEPVSSLLVAFGWGALVATAIALFFNTVAAAVIEAFGLDPEFYAAVFVAPVVEESAKGLGILVVWAMRRREFDGVLDGIVYAGIVAAGFAFAENILYLGQALQEDGPEGLALTFVLRGVMSPFAHPLFTSCTGVGIGVAVVGRTPLRFLAPIAGWVLAVLLHGFWNAGSSFGFSGWIGSYLLVQVPVFVAAVCFALWARRREDRLVAENLRFYASHGLFSPADLAMLRDARTRRAALDRARQVGGRQARAAMRDFQDDAVDLACLRARYLRGRSGPEIAHEERELIDSVLRARRAFTGS
ncbi:PrsW family intramembrane metalloprotease [Mobilicoccus massiliensis]|uniref:PrsW family intramembrane metalloprotease n=1 Tax=Mobilicoccus massiliensis TaxID=1522310 RepID=UPI0009E4921E|nr:PrsW family intramembrane metalloprotease [Mobilicoccus massiliensis]